MRGNDSILLPTFLKHLKFLPHSSSSPPLDTSLIIPVTLVGRSEDAEGQSALLCKDCQKIFATGCVNLETEAGFAQPTVGDKDLLCTSSVDYISHSVGSEVYGGRPAGPFAPSPSIYLVLTLHVSIWSLLFGP